MLTRTVVLVGLCSMFTDVSTEMVYPLLPFFLVSLGATPALLGVVEGIVESLANFLRVGAGAVSDRFGRRKPLAVGGYAAASVGKLLLALAGSWLGVLVARAVDRVGKGLRAPPRDALIADSTPESVRGRAFGFHRAMDTLGAAIGGLVAWALLDPSAGNIRQLMYLSIIPAVLGVAMISLVREPPRGQRQRVTGRPRPLRTLREIPARLRAFYGVVLIFSLAGSSNQFLLLRAEGLGHSPRDVILLYMTYNLVYSLTAYPAGRLSDRIGRRWVLSVGYLVYALTYLGFAVVQAPGALWVLFGVYGLYSGLTEGVEKALVADMAPQRLRATLLGVHAAVVGTGVLPASIIAGLLWESSGPKAPFFFAACLGVAAAGALPLVLAGGQRPGGADASLGGGPGGA